MSKRHPMLPSAPYDDIAEVYDDLFNSPEKEAENRRLFKELGYTGGPVLDIGCGTGLLLRYMTPDNYTGLDPSPLMLWELEKEHGPQRVIQCKFEKYICGRQYALIVALFGAASYVDPDELVRVPSMLVPGGKYFLMFYADGYTPETHVRTGVYPPTYKQLPDLPVKPETMFDNYVVMKGVADGD